MRRIRVWNVSVCAAAALALGLAQGFAKDAEPSPAPTPTSTPKAEPAHGPWGDLPSAKEADRWDDLRMDYRNMIQAKVDLDMANICGTKDDIRKAQAAYDRAKANFNAVMDAYITATAALSGAKPPKKGEKQTREEKQAYDDAVGKIMAALKKSDSATLIKGCPDNTAPQTPGGVKANAGNNYNSTGAGLDSFTPVETETPNKRGPNGRDAPPLVPDFGAQYPDLFPYGATNGAPANGGMPSGRR